MPDLPNPIGHIRRAMERIASVSSALRCSDGADVVRDFNFALQEHGQPVSIDVANALDRLMMETYRVVGFSLNWHTAMHLWARAGRTANNSACLRALADALQYDGERVLGGRMIEAFVEFAQALQRDITA